MLRSITLTQLLEWQAFAADEPLDRDTIQLALIAYVLWNANRDAKKYPKGLPLEEFILFKEKLKKEVQTKQTTAQIERMLDDWILGNNAFYAAQEKRIILTDG